MAANQHSRDLGGISARKSLSNDVSRLPLIVPGNLLRSHRPGTWHRPIKIIRLRRSVGHDLHACLRKGRCPTAVRMHNASAVRKRGIKHQMSRRITGWSPFFLYSIARHVHHNHIRKGHGLIGYSGWLDDNQPALPVYS